MHIIYINSAENDVAKITGDDFKHLQVLRVKVGDQIKVSDKNSYIYIGTIENISKNEAVISLTQKTQIEKKNTTVTLFHALCKSDKNEFVVQKATELGADKVVLFSSENCVVKVNEKSEAKIKRMNKIAHEASMQCGREEPMSVEGVLNFNEAVKELASADLPLFFYEFATDSFTQKLKNSNVYGNISVMIGSEGGFSDKEADIVKNMDVPILSLGKRILRTETAPIVVLSVLMEHCGEF
ncbi:MAG: 16S rRNA methyltransferase [Clostridiales bacterium]|nr:MAG: 16S rRNA methyltransferase [Clostridiales bacterium]